MKNWRSSMAFLFVVGSAAPVLADDPPAEAPKAEGTSEAARPAETAAAEAEGGSAFSYTLELDGASSYVWRGLRFSSKAFKPVFQPYIEASYSGVGPGAITAG